MKKWILAGLIVLLVALGGYYYVAVYVPAQGQGEQLTDLRYERYINHVCTLEDLSCDTEAIVRQYREDIALCERLHDETTLDNVGVWRTCLENQGVEWE